MATENNEWFLDDAGQLEFQGVQVAAAVKKQTDRHCTHNFLEFIFMCLSFILQEIFSFPNYHAKKICQDTVTMNHCNQV